MAKQQPKSCKKSPNWSETALIFTGGLGFIALCGHDNEEKGSKKFHFVNHVDTYIVYILWLYFSSSEYFIHFSKFTNMPHSLPL